MDLKEILNRRSDLSTFLVHLTRDFEGQSAKERLQLIINDGRINANSIYGLLASRKEALTEEAANGQKVVCFSETPLEYTYMMLNKSKGANLVLGLTELLLPRKSDECAE